MPNSRLDGLKPRLSPLGFGTAPLGDLYRELDEAEAIEAITAAVASGMTLIDTSPLYGHGLAEHRVGAALRRVGREKVVLSTKVGRVLSAARGPWDREGYAGGLPFAATIDYSYDGAMRSIEQSLLRLGTNRIDIALIHDVDRRNFGDAVETRFREAVSGAWRALTTLRDEGLVAAIGIGVNESDICMRFAAECDLDCVMLAGRYTLLDQSALGDFLPLAAERGIGILLGGVFNSGILATGAQPGATFDYAPAPPAILERTRRIEAVANRYRVPLAVAAIQAVRHHPAIASVVLGGVSAAEVERNRSAWDAAVPSAFWQELKVDGLIPAHMPTGA
jgi:D-threo-aldose 1-dehydrogenase